MVRDALRIGAKSAGPCIARLSARRRQDRYHRRCARAGPDLSAQGAFYQPHHPAHAIRATRAGLCVADGYSIEVWRDGGTEYWAISDVDPAEPAKFRQLFEDAAKPVPEKNG
jgi:hypothetical protein